MAVKPVNKNMAKIPRWLELQGEIDYLHFLLLQMYKKETSLTAIEKMVDEATGHDKHKLKEATKIIKKLRKLKKEFYEITA